MKVVISKLAFNGPSGFREVEFPNWQEIQDLVLELREATGAIDMRAMVEGSSTLVSINAEAGLYVVEVRSTRRELFKLLVNRTTANPDDLVPMCDGESLRKDTVDDLGQVLTMVEHYLESGQLVDSDPFLWIDS